MFGLYSHFGVLAGHPTDAEKIAPASETLVCISPEFQRMPHKITADNTLVVPHTQKISRDPGRTDHQGQSVSQGRKSHLLSGKSFAFCNPCHRVFKRRLSSSVLGAGSPSLTSRLEKCSREDCVPRTWNLRTADENKETNTKPRNHACKYHPS